MSKELLQAKRQEIEANMGNHMQNLQREVETFKEKLEAERQTAQRASAMGDRSENAEWQIANDNIARLIVSITTLTDTLDTYERYKGAYQPTGKVMLGSTLKIVDKNNNATLFIRIYPAGLGNAKIGAVTVMSPVGAALLNKTAGTDVVVKTPLGDITYYIEEVL
jgi:transcription elongation GreA/GreB family factor